MEGSKRVAAAATAILLVVLMAGCTRRARPTPTLGPAGLAEVARAVAAATASAVRPTATEAPAAATSSATGLPAAGATGLPAAGALPEPTSGPQVYVVRQGDTLSSIAARFGTTLNALMKANQITNANLLKVGQRLQIPSTQLDAGPALQLLPDSEFVNGPAYVDFDLDAFVAGQGGYLAGYSERVGAKVLSGAEIVERAAHEYSVGPRMLLAVLESKSGWVTDPYPGGAARSKPMGYTGGGWQSLFRQLAWAANELNRGYYDWRGRGARFITWRSGTATRYDPSLNAATAGLQYFYSLNSNRSAWSKKVGEGPGSFLSAYRSLFGDPAQYAIEPLVPSDTALPLLDLPWAEGELWYYTSGPHGGWGEGSAWAAIDVVPAEGYLGCQMASSWARAAAAGRVIDSGDGVVMVDLDGDGYEQTGWVLLYLHVAKQGRVAKGTDVQQGDRIGHPSCEGGVSEATHLHFARKYNGEWIAADGPLPMVLSGWQFHSDGVSYDGTATRGSEERTACECHEPEFNGLVAD